MNRHVLIAASLALLAGGALGVSSCTTPQPPLECGFAPLYWAKYDLVSTTTPGGACTTWQGDRIDFQKYQPPGATNSTFAFLPRRVGRLGRIDPCSGAADGLFFRTDPTDPDHQKEAPRGTYPDTVPNADGFCAATSIVPGAQNYPEVTPEMCLDAGVNPYRADGVTPRSAPMPRPAATFSDTWTNYKQLSTARFNSNIWVADLAVTRTGAGAPACDAVYKVTGFFPPVGCDTADDWGPDAGAYPGGNEDCNPEANLALSRATGSGISAEFKPRCQPLTDAYAAGYIANFPGGVNGVTNTLTGNVDGVCVPTVSIDDLAALK